MSLSHTAFDSTEIRTIYIFTKDLTPKNLKRKNSSLFVINNLPLKRGTKIKSANKSISKTIKRLKPHLSKRVVPTKSF